MIKPSIGKPAGAAGARPRASNKASVSNKASASNKPSAPKLGAAAQRATVRDAAARATPAQLGAEGRRVGEGRPGVDRAEPTARVHRVSETPGGAPGASKPAGPALPAGGAADPWKPLDRERLVREFDPVRGGQHLQSHAARGRDFAEFNNLRTQAERQTASQRIVEGILRDPRTAQTTNGPRFGHGTDFHSPDGRAIRFDGNGNFVGFLDTGTNGGAPRAAPAGAPTAGQPTAAGQPAAGQPAAGQPGRPGVEAAPGTGAPRTTPGTAPEPSTSALGRLGRLGGRLLGPLGLYLMFRDFQEQMQNPPRQPDVI